MPRIYAGHIICQIVNLLFLFFSVQSYQFLQISISLHSLCLVLCEQSLSFLRICSLQCIVTNFSVKECLILFLLRLFAVKGELRPLPPD